MSIKIAGREAEAFVFDLERTLYTSEDADRIFAAARRQLAIALLGKSEDSTAISNDRVEEKLTELLTLAEQAGWSQAYRQLGGDIDFYHRTVRGVDRSSGLKYNPDLRQMFEGLKTHAKLGLLSKAIVPTVDAICNKILSENWSELFDAVVCDGTPGCPAEKPDPLAFKFILEQLNTIPERAVMVGDNLADDILPAASLGMLTVLVGDQDRIGDLRISRIEDLATLIELPDN